VAKALLDAGASVAICGRTDEGVAKALKTLGGDGRKLAGRAADVSDADDVRAFFEFADQNLGGLDILINNAGVGYFSNVADTSLEDWHKTVGTNLNGAFYCSREALQRFRKRGGGFIVNISSLAGRYPMPRGGAYNASKFGLNGFSEAMMLDHRYDNVRVCSILPGSVDTEFDGKSSGADWKIAPQDLADIVLTVLRMPERTLISRVEVRPSKPKK
jgi:NAD(P)-dependent dehydrogenase (short-subunit alcohol dehydrogenase family)